MGATAVSPPPCSTAAAGNGPLPCLPSPALEPVERGVQPGLSPTLQPTTDASLQATADPSSAPADPGAAIHIAGIPLWALAAIAVLAITVLILGYLLARSSLHGKQERPAPRAANPVAAAPVDAIPVAAAPVPPVDSAHLLDALIGAYDLTTSEVVRAHVRRSLRTAGVTAIEPLPGEPFDSGLHNGVAAVPSPSPELALHVARVLRPGWLSEDSVLRPADVEVYKE